MIDTQNLWPDFSSFWNAARGQSLEKQKNLWHKLYESRHLEIFRVYFSAPYWGRREHLTKAFKRYKKDFKKICETTRKVEEIIPGIVQAALTVFGISEADVEIQVVTFVGVYDTDGFGFPMENQTTIFLALERLAGYEPERRKILIAHEFSHALHMELGKHAHPKDFAKIAEDPAQLLRVGSGLFMEGLAVAASKRIVPGLDKRTYFFYGPEQWMWCQANRSKLLNLALDELGSQDQGAYYKYFTSSEPVESLPYHRTGYYIGYLAIEQLLKQYSLRELAEVDPKKYPDLIHEALKKR